MPRVPPTFVQEDILEVMQVALPDRMIIFLDDEGRVVFCSNTLLGCDDYAVYSLGQSIYEHSTCGVFEVFRSYPKARLRALKAPVTSTVSVTTSKGEVGTFLTTLAPLVKTSHGSIAFLFSVVDQTALTAASQALSLQKDLLKNVLHNLPDVVFAKDLEGRFLVCNAQCEALLGVAPSQALGRKDADFFAPEIAQAIRAQDAKVLELGVVQINEEWLRYPDGHEVLFETTKAPLRTEEGAFIGILGIAHDITHRKRLEEHLHLTQFSVDKAVVPIFWIDAVSGKMFYVNEAACESLGYTKEELTQLGVIDIDPNFDQVAWDAHAKNLNRIRASHFETLHRRKDGSIFPVEVFASIFVYQGKDYNIAFAINISERLEKEAVLAKKEAMLRASQRIAKVGSWELDIEQKTLVWSDETYRIFGIDPVRPLHIEDSMNAIHPEDREATISAYWASTQDPKNPYHDMVHRIVVEGEVRFVHEQCETLHDATGKPLRSIGTVRDVTDERALMEQIEYLSLHDPLTKLPNQLLLKRELGYALKRARKTHTLVAVCFIDLDDFKYINDLYSHETGDRILQEVAHRLQEVANHSYTLARFGADEFVVIVEEIASPSHVIAKLDAFLHVLKAPFSIEGRDYTMTVSVGISLSPNDANEAEDLIKFADVAMHQAKHLGRNKYAFYSQVLSDQMGQRMRIVAHFKKALEARSFTLYYQPQIDLGTMQVVGFEALLRWEHPTLGFINPTEFIPLAEENGLIIPLGKWVLETACTQLKEWHEAGVFTGTVAVNVSGVQLDEGRFTQTVAHALEASGLGSESLELEITESSLMGNPAAWRVEFEKLDKLGVKLAMDDFGTGYSSLSHLRQMPLDVLKIDQSFVFDLPQDADACVVAKAIVGLAQNMKMDALAEGIETKEQLAFLKELGCGFGQGYYIAKPMPASEVSVFLTQWDEKTPYM
ncbi:MAG: EAL domain-containing protein [Campylobacterales bacterium]|nr:EAL domain-containing protein [Campylobacterales bacterium]